MLCITHTHVVCSEHATKNEFATSQFMHVSFVPSQILKGLATIMPMSITDLHDQCVCALQCECE